MFKIDSLGLIYFSDIVSIDGGFSLNGQVSVGGEVIIHNLIPPIIQITSTDRLKISNVIGVDRMNIVFRFLGYAVEQWTVNLGGTSYNTGTVIEQSVATLPENQDATVEIDYTELGSEGQNRINIYGKSASFDKTWSEYNQS